MQAGPRLNQPTGIVGYCHNHPQVSTGRRCIRCSGAFCNNCLVVLQGRALCAACKDAELRDLQRLDVGGVKLADDAFKYSLIGMVCFGLVLEPLAMYKGIKALQQYKANPELPNRWKAVSAIWISSIVMVLNVLYVLFTVLSRTAPTGG